MTEVRTLTIVLVSLLTDKIYLCGMEDSIALLPFEDMTAGVNCKENTIWHGPVPGLSDLRERQHCLNTDALRNLTERLHRVFVSKPKLIKNKLLTEISDLGLRLPSQISRLRYHGWKQGDLKIGVMYGR